MAISRNKIENCKAARKEYLFELYNNYTAWFFVEEKLKRKVRKINDMKKEGK